MAYTLGYGHEVWSAGGYYFWIPMVAPFCGTLVGGFLYDLLIYTGPESPVNSPWMGIPHLIRPDRAVQKRWAERSGSDDELRGSLSTAVDLEKSSPGSKSPGAFL